MSWELTVAGLGMNNDREVRVSVQYGALSWSVVNVWRYRWFDMFSEIRHDFCDLNIISVKNGIMASVGNNDKDEQILNVRRNKAVQVIAKHKDI